MDFTMPQPITDDAMGRMYPLGARVYATRSSGVCGAGEAGVVVEEYCLGDGLGRTILFEGGNYDGFSARDFAMFIVAEGGFDRAAQAYRFLNVGELARDHQKGIFDFKSMTPYAQWIANKEALDIEKSAPPAAPRAKPSL